MRLFNMYYACKMYRPIVNDMVLLVRSDNNRHNINSISGWQKNKAVLNEIAKIKPLQQYVNDFINVFPVWVQDSDTFEVSDETAKKYNDARRNLLMAMNTTIDLYECMNADNGKGCADGGFDIKLPEFKSIDEFSECLKDLSFVIEQCPYMREEGTRVEYGTMDVGSTWLTFVVCGAGTVAVLSALAKLVDVALKVKSHATTVKMQEEQLKEMQMKNGLVEEVVKAFDQVNKAIVDKYVQEIEQDLGELSDGEERDKVGRSLEKLAYWMDRGMQIYSTIDAPKEIRDLFPKQEEISFLSDDLLKLIETKKTE